MDQVFTPPVQLKKSDVEVRVSGSGKDVKYETQLVRLKIHPSPIVEPTNLASEPIPQHEYVPRLRKPFIENGGLSALQFEAVALAGFRHCQRVLREDGELLHRLGFFLGDATGVGKGRTISGIIADNFLRGRRRAIWVSCSRSLLEDAKVAFRGIGFDDIPVYELGGSGDGIKGTIHVSHGVIFVTYMLLARDQSMGGKRLCDIVQWLAGCDEEGVIVFDECHRAKNLVPVAGQPTATGLAVQAIQQALPDCRIVYASATGMSTPKGIAPFTRLGIWGDAAVFKDFDDFSREIEGNNAQAVQMSRMELVARDIKAEGAYLSRSLSYEGIHFETKTIEMTGHFRLCYNQCCEWWEELLLLINDFKQVFGYVDGETGKPKTHLGHVKSLIWSTHQRFFKLLIVSSKIDYVVKACENALANNCSPVVAMFSTGDSAVQREIEQLKEDEANELTEFISSLRSSTMHLLKNHLDPINGKMVNEDSELAPAYQERLNDVIEALGQLELPDSPLDVLIERLGGHENVAELTGRTNRLIDNDEIEGEKKLVDRREEYPAANSIPDVNNYECRAFQNGDKAIAVITAAASSGISLHCDKSVKNQRRRIMFCIELSFSADSTIQQLGRIHRSNQCRAPRYELVSARLGGEARFISAVTERLKMLGALTKADSNAAIASKNFLDETFFNQYGENAAKKVWRFSQKKGVNYLGQTPPCCLSNASRLTAEEECDKYFPEHITREIIAFADYSVQAFGEELEMEFRKAKLEAPKKGVAYSKLFWNRLLGVKCRIQNAAFNFFEALYRGETMMAKIANTYNTSTIIDPCQKVKRAQANPVEQLSSKVSGVATQLHHFTLDRGISYDELQEIIKKERETRREMKAQGLTMGNFFGSHDGFYRLKTEMAAGKRQYEPFWALEVPQQASGSPSQISRIMRIFIPHRGEVMSKKGRPPCFKRVVNVLDLANLLRHRRIQRFREHGFGAVFNEGTAKRWWDEQYEQALESCSTCANCRRRPPTQCSNGSGRMEQLTLMTGRVLQVFDIVKDIVKDSDEDEAEEVADEDDMSDFIVEDGAYERRDGNYNPIDANRRATQRLRQVQRRNQARRAAQGANYIENDDYDKEEEILLDKKKKLQSHMNVVRVTVTEGKSKGESIVGLKILSDRVNDLRKAFKHAHPDPGKRRRDRELAEEMQRAQEQKQNVETDTADHEDEDDQMEEIGTTDAKGRSNRRGVAQEEETEELMARLNESKRVGFENSSRVKTEPVKFEEAEAEEESSASEDSEDEFITFDEPPEPVFKASNIKTEKAESSQVFRRTCDIPGRKKKKKKASSSILLESSDSESDLEDLSLTSWSNKRPVAIKKEISSSSSSLGKKPSLTSVKVKQEGKGSLFSGRKPSQTGVKVKQEGARLASSPTSVKLEQPSTLMKSQGGKRKILKSEELPVALKKKRCA